MAFLLATLSGCQSARQVFDGDGDIIGDRIAQSHRDAEMTRGGSYGKLLTPGASLPFSR